MKKTNIYLDYAAGTPVRREVIDAMSPYQDLIFANPSSTHSFGRQAREAIELARSDCALVLGCNPDEIIFNSGGTESDFMAIFGTMMASDRPHLVTSQIEHPAVLLAAESLSNIDKEALYAPVDEFGMIKIDQIDRLINKEAALASIIYVNNEIGVMQNIKALAKMAHNKGAVFHTDACQAALTEDTSVNNLGVDLMTINASKIYGPKGVGLLYIKRGTPFTPVMPGGGQEMGQRGGTENVAGIVGLSTALKLAQKEKEAESVRLQGLGKHLIAGITSNTKSRLVGHKKSRVAHIITLHFENTEAGNLIQALDERGIYVSAGSACSAENTEASHVLQAIGMSDSMAFECVRFSLGRETIMENIQATIKNVTEIVKAIKYKV